MHGAKVRWSGFSETLTIGWPAPKIAKHVLSADLFIQYQVIYAD